jgi:hypothetical protein
VSLVAASRGNLPGPQLRLSPGQALEPSTVSAGMAGIAQPSSATSGDAGVKFG